MSDDPEPIKRGRYLCTDHQRRYSKMDVVKCKSCGAKVFIMREGVCLECFYESEKEAAKRKGDK